MDQPPWIVGVLNVTPDSFSDGGRFVEPDAALEQARALHREGAHLVDIGGESTRAGSKPVSSDEEWRRIGPVVAELAGSIRLSLDTYHARTAERGLETGAVCINDVSAGRADPDMMACVGAKKALYVMTFAKDGPLPHASDRPVSYDDIVGHLAAFFQDRIEAGLKAGIAIEQFVVDPGLGRFVSADTLDSWRILAGIERLIEAVKPVPLMIGASRKGFLGGRLADRDPLSQHVSCLMAARGAHYIRTHNVAMARSFLDADRKLGILTGD